jgi:uncharacterized membrane protein
MIATVIKNRPRLIVAFGLAALLTLLLPQQWTMLSRILFGWNVGVWSYLVLMFWLMVRASAEKVASLAEQEDNADIAIIAIMSIAAMASLAAIVLELGAMKELSPTHKLWHYLITVATVIGSWFFIATIFTLHYARLYYRSPAQQRALHFPDTHLQPTYWDFLYFSFTIAVAAQTSDISLTSRVIRKTALVQSVLSFWFNMAILGLSINIAAGIVGA